MRTLIVIGALALIATPALAHVVVAPDKAPANSYFVGAFRVGHGCEGEATTSVRIAIPEALDTARPKAVPGWRMKIEREKGIVTAVTWTGRLPDDQFQTFELLMKLPAEAQTLTFPTVQQCGKLQSRWNGEDAGHPAPTLTVIAPQGGEHDHH